MINIFVKNNSILNELLYINKKYIYNIMEFITILNTGLSITKIAKHIIPKHEKTQFIDPLSAILRLVINGYKPVGTKICVFENRIALQEPSYFQGSLRTVNGDNKEDLHFLLEPIKNSCERYFDIKDDERKEKLKFLFEKAKLGLFNLKNTYQDYPLISRCIELYIKYLDNYLNNKLETKNDNIQNSILIEKEIYDKIYDNFDKIWSNNRLNIIYCMIVEIDKYLQKGKTKELNDLINILDNFVLLIEKESRNLIISIL
jgi:hypothetical protein